CRTGLTRLLAVVVAIGVLATVTAFAIGPFVVTTLFGADFRLSHTDLGYLAGASAVYMLALALAQALIALANYPRVVVGWAVGLVAFVIVTALSNDLLPRVDRGFLAGSAASAAMMAWAAHRLLSTRIGKTHEADERLATRPLP